MMANLGFNQLQRFHVEFGDVAVAKAADGAAPADRGPPPLPLLPPQRRRAGRLLPGRDLRRPRRLPTAHQDLKPSPLPGGESRRRGNNFIPHIPLFILSSQSLFKKIYCYCLFVVFPFVPNLGRRTLFTECSSPNRTLIQYNGSLKILIKDILSFLCDKRSGRLRRCQYKTLKNFELIEKRILFHYPA